MNILTDGWIAALTTRQDRIHQHLVERTITEKGLGKLENLSGTQVKSVDAAIESLIAHRLADAEKPPALTPTDRLIDEYLNVARHLNELHAEAAQVA